MRGPPSLIAHGGEPLKYVVAAAGRTPSVYYKVGLSSAGTGEPARRRLYGLLAGQATHVIGVSQAITEQAHIAPGSPQREAEHHPERTQPQVYRPPNREEHRSEPPLVIFVARLEAGKRPDLFLDVVEVLRGSEARHSTRPSWMAPALLDRSPGGSARDVDLLGVRKDVRT